MKLYSYLTGPDDENFCKRVTAKLNTGWELYGNPTLACDGNTIIAGQAMIKEVAGEYHQGIDLKKQ